MRSDGHNPCSASRKLKPQQHPITVWILAVLPSTGSGGSIPKPTKPPSPIIGDVASSGEIGVLSGPAAILLQTQHGITRVAAATAPIRLAFGKRKPHHNVAIRVFLA